MEFTLESGDNALYPLLHFVLDDLPNKTKNPEFDWTNLREFLQGSGISCPPASDILGTYLAFLVKIGHIPPPQATGEPLPRLTLNSSITGVSRTSNAD